MAFGALSLKGRALRWLAQREHSRAELQRKLALHLRRAAAPSSGSARSTAEAHGDDFADGLDGANAAGSTGAAEIAAVLDQLVAAGLLSDDRAAASVLHSQGARCGSRRLKQVLQNKGLAPELVASTLQQASATELERARSLWRRRFEQAPQDAGQRARQSRFLLARGFAGQVVSQVLREAGRSAEDDESPGFEAED